MQHMKFEDLSLHNSKDVEWIKKIVTDKMDRQKASNRLLSLHLFQSWRHKNVDLNILASMVYSL